MRRIIFVFFCLFSLLFCGCAVNRDSAEQMMTKALHEAKGLPDAYIYTDSADISEEGFLSWEDLGALYYDSDGIPKEKDAIDSFCIRISKTPEIHEIHIIKTKHKSDNDLILRMFKRRAEMLTSPQINPNDSPFISNVAEKCEYFSHGNFVFLIAGSDTSEMLKAINNYF